MMTNSNPGLWDSNGNLIVARHGIRIAMALGVVAAGAYWLFAHLGDRHWYKHNPEATPVQTDPLWLILLWIALALAPFLVSVFLLSRRAEESKAIGAGVAIAVFAFGFIFSIAAFVGEFLVLSPDPYGWHRLITAVIFVLCSLWVFVAAFRIAAKTSWGLFLLSAAAALVCVGVGNHYLEKTEHELDQQYEREQTQKRITATKASFDARGVLARLAACLIQYQASHRDLGFPASLNALPHDVTLPQGTVCDARIAEPGTVPDYTFIYTPRRRSSPSKATDFLLVALPLRKGVPRMDPMAVDSRGRIFTYIGWSLADRVPESAPALTETPDDFRQSQLLGVRE